MCQDPVRRISITLIKGVSLSAADLKTQISERSARAVMVRPARPSIHGGIEGEWREQLGTRAVVDDWVSSSHLIQERKGRSAIRTVDVHVR